MDEKHVCGNWRSTKRLGMEQQIHQCLLVLKHFPQDITDLCGKNILGPFLWLCKFVSTIWLLRAVGTILQHVVSLKTFDSIVGDLFIFESQFEDLGESIFSESWRVHSTVVTSWSTQNALVEIVDHGLSFFCDGGSHDAVLGGTSVRQRLCYAHINVMLSFFHQITVGFGVDLLGTVVLDGFITIVLGFRAHIVKFQSLQKQAVLDEFQFAFVLMHVHGSESKMVTI
ncbi:hypothetical protein OGAPHI_003445 [Ogataea philodendri]|uniref:Uncharacterized protein n=1 Tax=Ogataea philodendri TaxID=1378263 RepID=A0A9P8P856_9ASCO|nr:uncharacterized protein OGAPHI_003445 [Ogataea philodendri]KAH3666449.1 hypothetical protein OGAPHI_003445 [Ogataea philodendri]